jgi:ABC-type lipoprotein release transport system permease subunit
VGAVAARLRAALRGRPASAVAIVLLIAVAGGAVLAATAGARRTASAYPRMLEASNSYDVLVSPDTDDVDLDAIEALPQVDDAARIYGMFAAPRGPDGLPDFDSPVLPVASDGRWGYEVGRPVNVDGRLPRQDRHDEVALSRPGAETLGLGVGDRLPILAFTSEEAPPATIDARVVGIGLFPMDALQEEDDPLTSPLLLFTPAFRERFGDTFTAMTVRLRDGTDTRGELAAAARDLTGGRLFLQFQAETTEKAQRSLRPYVAALWLFAAATALAALLVVGQALTRHLLADASSLPTLGALGMTRGQLIGGAVLHAVLLGVAGAVGAVALAVALSPLLPVGPARSVDPDVGIHADVTVLALGAGGLVALAAVGGAAAAMRSVVAAGRPVPALRRSRLGELLGRLGAPATATAGVRMAVETGRGATSVPVRTTLVGAVAGLAALIAAITFGAGLDHLLSSPHLYGWDWDAIVHADGNDPGGMEALLRRAPEMTGVAAITEGTYGQLDAEGRSVAAVGLGRDDAPTIHPPMLEGRPAARADEVVLGTTTLDRLDRRVGDDVRLAVGDRTVQARIVGRTVFPKFAAYPGSDRTGLGVGAAMTMEGLRRLIPGAGLDFALVRFASGTPREEGVAAMRTAAIPVRTEDPSVVPPRVEVGPNRPDDLSGYDGVNTTPLVLAGLLSLLTVGTTAHGLLTATRRRRLDLGLLKAVGFTRRQVSAAVAWQATTVAVVALLVGLPLGVAVGRWLWGLLAGRLGIPSEPVTPLLALLLAVPATLLLLNLVATVPGRRAGGIPAAAVLRSE